MKEQLREIVPGTGLGKLKFGLSREQAKQLLGEPDEAERYNLSEDGGDETEAWHYDELGLSLSFDQEHAWKLSSIAVSSGEYTLEGESLIGRSKAEILDLLDGWNWDEPEEDEEVSREDPGNSLLHIENAALSLWFEDDELSELQIGPTFEDGRIIWPS